MLIQGNSIELLDTDDEIAALKGKVNLIITSPPFLLNYKKQYGNEKGEEYLKWFIELAPIFSELLADDGSLVYYSALNDDDRTDEQNKRILAQCRASTMFTKIQHI